MNNFPFLTQKQALLLLRMATALIFMAHAIVRIGNGTIGQFGDFLNNKGFVYGVAWVWGITTFEIIGGTLLAAGYFVKWMAAGFIILLVIGIIIIHAENGWFTGEHGSGGIEYSASLIVSLLVIAAGYGKDK